MDYSTNNFNEWINKNTPYERMMNRQEKLAFEELVHYCGVSGGILKKLNKYMINVYRAEMAVCFPYGTEGWCVRYSRKGKRIFDIFPENGAFTLNMRISNAVMEIIYSELSGGAKYAWDNRLCCQNGHESRILFRVFDMGHLQDIQKIIFAKFPGYMKNKRAMKLS